MYTKYLKQHPEFKTIVSRVKELFKASKYNPTELSKLIDTYLIPQENEKKQNAEVSTPYALRQEMLNSIPKDFWTQPRTVFEPCCGKGGFVLDVVNRFMEGLQKHEPNEGKRYKLIVEKCVYFADINPVNIFITRLLLDPKEQYNLPYYEGNTLEINTNKEFQVESFDLVVGNPPYKPPSNGKKGGKSLWPEFVKYAHQVCRTNGYIVYVHPALWRKPENELHDLMFSKEIIKLSIHNDQESKSIFGVTTRYDWYVMKNTIVTKDSNVRFDDGKEMNVKIDKDLLYIPNRGLSILLKLKTKGETDGFLKAYQSCEGHTQRVYIQKEHDETHIYPIFNASSTKNGIVVYWSDQSLSFQSVKKVLFSNGRHIVPFYDSGKLGMTQGGMYISVANEEEGVLLSKYLKSRVISYIISATKWSNFETNRQVFSLIPTPKTLKCGFDDTDIYKWLNLSLEEISQIETEKYPSLKEYSVPRYD